ncbi:uncharacterized protein LOC131846328 [Achroia grisella]|uniref:uncharacterized protein LOC131846328 n=1 Tax=Achroia grisella TaxID=688607 RepID=UPI0027D32C89|nr:uncharacterized protein LOC131846328 [Achroia grisella]
MSYIQNTWFSKKDVLEDLSRIGIANLEDSYILTGQRPPPTCREVIDDEEFELRFNGTVHNGLVYESVEPDLKGITDYLRMVDDVECSPRDSPTEVITISKLNPNVREFIPNTSKASEPKTRNAENNTNNIETTAEIIDNGVDLTKLKQQEINDIAEKLRDKVSNSSRADTSQQKKERNVAIAALLKLYSAKPKTKTPSTFEERKEDEPLKLVTPDFFIGNKIIEHSSNTVCEQDLCKTSLSDSVHEQTSSSDALESCSSTSYTIDSSVQESIDKVNNWFGDTKCSSKKAPAISLEPPVFKRKEPRSIKSSCDGRQRYNGNSQNGHYKPSKYADDLCKMYTKRTEERETARQDIWTKVQAELKAKDEILIRKKMEEDTTDDNI